jgi:hypothetical protein
MPAPWRVKPIQGAVSSQLIRWPRTGAGELSVARRRAAVCEFHNSSIDCDGCRGYRGAPPPSRTCVFLPSKQELPDIGKNLSARTAVSTPPRVRIPHTAFTRTHARMNAGSAAGVIR